MSWGIPVLSTTLAHQSPTAAPISQRTHDHREGEARTGGALGRQPDGRAERDRHTDDPQHVAPRAISCLDSPARARTSRTAANAMAS